MIKHTCQECGAEFVATRADAAYCGSRCRTRTFRARSAARGRRDDLVRELLRRRDAGAYAAALAEADATLAGV